ncbi:amidohydrolase family protein [Micromonospora sp. NPDC048898]|uniref:amidohydrolase family protein n=1 Tax=Micromonospora sp. NPDC048898 TaxID=3364260 RepID=UPI00371D2654
MTKHAVRAARMFDGERLVDGGVLILLDDERIADVRRGWAEAPVREEPDGTVLSGLVDAHVHLCADAGPDALGRLAERSETDLDAVVEASLRTHLAAGVTTVRDLGDWRGAVLRWREWAVRNDLPTVVGSGAPITSVGDTAGPWGRGERRRRDPRGRAVAGGGWRRPGEGHGQRRGVHPPAPTSPARSSPTRS